MPSRRGGVYSEPSGVSSRQRRFRLLVIAAVILLVIAGAVLFVRTLDSPVLGSVNQTPPSQAVKVDPYSQPGTYKGKYITFTYPEHYKSSPTSLSGSYLEVAAYSYTAGTYKQLSVGVQPGSLSSDGSIAYRQQHPELYRETTSPLGIEFVNKAGTEDTFYIAHNGLIASVSVTAPGADLDNDALYVAGGLRWR